MKKFLMMAVLFIAFFSAFSATFDATKYEELAIEKVKATPEEYKNKKIFIETVFLMYATTFLPYMEKSGFKAGKDYYIQVKPDNFPVMSEKNDETNAIIPGLKVGSKLRLYGKIKKFKSPPVQTVLPLYYLELDHIEVLEIGSGKLDEEKDLPKAGGRKFLKNKFLQ
jgi:hypothetical protein